jgi:iron complex outermembrane receptor protein
MAFLAGLAPAPLSAEDVQSRPDLMDMSLQDLMNVEIDSVYGASGYKQNVNDTPASITIITADEIKRYGYRTLADILRNVPGFYVTSDRLFSYIGVRGFGPPGDYNSRVLLLIDGHWANDNVTGGAVFGTEMPFDVDLIERVEVIRGPNSSVYIASALLAIVNVVTKRGRDVKGLSASEELASYRTYKSNLIYGHQFTSGLEVLLSGSFYYSHGPDQLYFKEFNSPATNYGIAQNADEGRFSAELAKLSYHGLTLEEGYGYSEQHDPTASYGGIFDDSEGLIRIVPAFADLSYEHHFGGDWGYVGRLYYDKDQIWGTTPVDESAYGGAAHVLNQDLSVGQDVGASFELSKKLPLGQTVVVGSEFRDNFQQKQWNYDEQPYALYFNGHDRSNLWGAHAQDEIPIRSDLTLDLGLSYDHYSTFGGTANPRAGLIYQPREGTSLKFLYGQSFRAPTAYELYYSAEGQEPNPNLGPETAKTTEMVFEQSLAKNFRLVASAYFYPMRGVISAVTDPATGLLVYQNSQRVDLRGTEITLKRQSRSGLEAGLSFSFEDATNLDVAGPLVNSPRVLGQASLSVPLFKKKVFASTDLQYVSKRKTEAGDSAGAYVLPNFTVFSPKVLKGLEFSASMYNAFNNLYGDPASVAHVEDIIFQNGRNFRLKLTYHF